MADYLFLFSIGPVQSFIAQARKPQDFAAGSAIISYLMNHAMTSLKDRKLSHEFIFPVESLKMKPHRFIAQITTDDPQKEGNAIERAVCQKFQDIAAKVFEYTHVAVSQEAMCRKFRKSYDQVIFPESLSKQEWPSYYEQIRQFLDVHWVMLPYDSAKDEYDVVYARLEQLLGEIKNIRRFEQMEECGRKCSMDGIRNVKIYRKTEAEHKQSNNLCKKKLFSSDGNNIIIVPYNANSPSLRDLQPGEGLSAVSWTKRCAGEITDMSHVTGQKLKDFPSTAEIALMNTLETLKKEPLYHEYPKLFDGKFDHQLLYEENLTRQFLEKYGYDDVLLTQGRCKILEDGVSEEDMKLYSGDKLREHGVKHIQKHYKEIAGKQKAFPKYYALLRFDGDNMGKWLAGDSEIWRNNQHLQTFHRVLSQQLGEFAKEAETYLRPPRGRTVYAGGDDFFGFVNLDSLFDVLEEFRKLFDKTVNEEVFEKTFLDEINPEQRFTFSSELVESERRLTFSAGLVLAHYKLPLSEIIKWSKKMEEAAKDRDGKNAVGIAALKHSGEITQTLWKWENENRNFLTICGGLVEKLQRALQDPEQPVGFSNTFINSLEREFSRLLDHEHKYIEPDIIETELRRLLRRACRKSKLPHETQRAYDERVEITQMTEQFKAMFYETGFNFHNFMALFHIADFIARKTLEAS